mgnify:CR=1 FL=1
MKADEVKAILKNLGFTLEDIKKLDLFLNLLLKFNNKYNLISKNTEKEAWSRHILDSAQLVKFINFNKSDSLADLGSGAGFPGLILSIFNKNHKFHVKLYEKSKVKCHFLKDAINSLNIKCYIYENDYQSHILNSDYIVCRAFKKLPEILRISRETAMKPHKLIVMLGKSAQEEINKASKDSINKYKLVTSITSSDSKILLLDANE